MKYLRFLAIFYGVDFVENRQYFTKNNDELASNPKHIYAKIKEDSFEFITDNGVFSKDFLDYATKILLENINIEDIKGPILDVGCGYGPIGIFYAKKTPYDVVMLDVNLRALSLSKQNLKLNNVCAEVLESNCLDAVLKRKFQTVITNPPIHAGKEIIYKIFDQSYTVLNEFGALFVVIQHKHGAPTTIKHLEEKFHNVEIIYKKKGFFILKCIKTN